MSDIVLSKDSWAQYAEYARHLDAVRAEESARTAGMREAVAEMTGHADDLEARLRGQGGMLIKLATTLRLRRPKLTPIPPEGVVDPPIALSELAAIIDRGDADALQAATRGQYPALLPAWSGTPRSLLVYGIAALAVLALQGLAFSQNGTETNPFMVLFVFPLIGFVIGYVVLNLGSRTRTATPPPNLPTRLGFLLCFLIGPLAALVAVLTSLQSGRGSR
ncbi:MAG TPA: hypothetical protein VLL08_11285 [Kineosporiaceae bacterium]|nr:hypothetical protein [Kineosporiaceae bacterium]